MLGENSWGVDTEGLPDHRDRLEIIADLVAQRKINFDLRKALKLAIRQNECDMLLTGDELRECNKALGV